MSALALVAVATAAANWFETRAQIPGLAEPVAVARLTRAARLRPGLADTWREWADVTSFAHPARARTLARRAVQLAPTDWRNWTSLALVDYRLNHLQAASSDFAAAARVDRGAAAHLQLANMAWLVGNRNLYWNQIRLALAVCSRDQYPAILAQVQRLNGPDTANVLRVLPPGQAGPVCGGVEFLCAMGHPRAATRAWQLMPSCTSVTQWACRGAALSLAHAWLADALHPGHQSTAVAPAIQYWNRAVAAGLLAGSASFGAITDGGFRYPWVGGLEWTSDSRVTLWRRAPDAGAGSGQAVMQLSGDQPDQSPLLWEWVPVSPGVHYRVAFQSRADDSVTGAGLLLQVATPDGVRLTQVVAPLQPNWNSASGSFVVPDHVYLLKVGFECDRPFGATLLRGEVSLRRVNLEAASGSDSALDSRSEHE
ncbi:MAG: hypothetical protein ACRD1M_02635 [Terriglobales bacterium]